MKKIRCSIYFLCAAVLPAPAAADITSPAGGAAVLQALLGLVLVIGLILGLAWLSRRLGAVPATGKIMRVLAVLPVGPREKIVLVEVGGQQMMLGVTPGQINTLQVFVEPVVAPPPVAAELARPGPVRAGSLAARSASEFSRKLQEFLNQGNKT